MPKTELPVFGDTRIKRARRCGERGDESRHNPEIQTLYGGGNCPIANQHGGFGPWASICVKAHMANANSVSDRPPRSSPPAPPPLFAKERFSARGPKRADLARRDALLEAEETGNPPEESLGGGGRR